MPPALSIAIPAGLLASLTRQAGQATQARVVAVITRRAARATDDIDAAEALAVAADALDAAALSLQAHTDLTRAALTLWRPPG